MAKGHGPAAGRLRFNGHLLLRRAAGRACEDAGHVSGQSGYPPSRGRRNAP